jgi:protein gp37
MPDGSIARCYAQDVAEGVASAAYPKGFEYHYWHPARLSEPAKVKTSSRIFMDSMSDFMGAWIPEEHVYKTLLTVRECYWHDFQMLTKNAPRILKFAEQIPRNLWIGVSMPPSIMLGRELTPDQQARYMEKAMYVFRTLSETWRKPNVMWLSLEPLSFDVADMIDFEVVNWIVIGAASNGRKKYQPNPEYVQNVLDKAQKHGTPVFFKGNLEWSPWMEEFPF